MAKLKRIYKCEICGNVVEVIGEGAGELVCCGQPMTLLQEKTEDEGLEKHKPVIEKTEKGFLVRVGSTPHPMEENHFIEWIELLADDRVFRKFLSPGDKPEAEFCIEAEKVSARALCNIHGLWRNSF